MTRKSRSLIVKFTLLSALALVSCGKTQEPPAGGRIAIPPALESVFDGYSPVRPLPFQFAPLLPYSRARDLEVLLFSSGSTAFQGVLMPARYIPLVAAWAAPFDVPLPASVRPDVAESVGGREAPLCLPVTMDCGVLVVREDLWRELGLAPPVSIAALRECAMAFQCRRGQRDVIDSDLPPDELFWDLAWSFEGAADPRLYSFSKVHALRFIQEFGLGQKLAGALDPEEDLRSGETAALFTSMDRAAALCRADPRLKMWPMPSGKGPAVVLYTGWCLAQTQASPAKDEALAELLDPSFQDYLSRKGFLPAAVPPAGEPVSVRTALEGTVFHGAPMLGASGDEIVSEGLLDATQGGMSAEEALRRAAARLQARASQGDGS